VKGDPNDQLEGSRLVLQNPKSSGADIRRAFPILYSNPNETIPIGERQTRFVIAELCNPLDPIRPVAMLRSALTLFPDHAASVIGSVVWRQTMRIGTSLPSEYFNSLPTHIREQTITSVKSLAIIAAGTRSSVDYGSSSNVLLKKFLSSLDQLLLQVSSSSELPDKRPELADMTQFIESEIKFYPELVRLLTQLGADEIHQGGRPLLYWNRRGLPVAKLLIDLADSPQQAVSALTDDGSNVLYWIHNHDRDLAMYLLETSSDPASMIMHLEKHDTYDKKIKSHLEHSVEEGDDIIVDLYLDTLKRAKRDIFVRNGIGRDLVRIAIQNRRPDVLGTILKFAPDVKELLNRLDCHKLTALSHARDRQRDAQRGGPILPEGHYDALFVIQRAIKASERIRELVDSHLVPPSKFHSLFTVLG
jgi:hypothetical protein